MWVGRWTYLALILMLPILFISFRKNSTMPQKLLMQFVTWKWNPQIVYPVSHDPRYVTYNVWYIVTLRLSTLCACCVTEPRYVTYNVRYIVTLRLYTLCACCMTDPRYVTDNVRYIVTLPLSTLCACCVTWPTRRYPQRMKHHDSSFISVLYCEPGAL